MRLSFSGMTSSGHVLDLLMQRRCCLQCFLPIVRYGCNGLPCPVPRRPCCCNGTSPPLAHEVAMSGSCRAFLLGVSSAACTRLPPSASVLASLHLPAWTSVHSWLFGLRFGSVSTPALLPAPTLILHLSAPVHRGAVADVRLGLA